MMKENGIINKKDCLKVRFIDNLKAYHCFSISKLYSFRAIEKRTVTDAFCGGGL